MAIAKVVYKENASATPEVWMDTTQKTVTAGTMLSGTTALKNDGTGITGNIASKSSSDLTASGATVTAPAGYYSNAASKSVASGSASTPATSITANPTISVNASGLITASVSGSKSVTPTVSAGYVSFGTAGTVSVSGSNTEQLSTQSGTTVTPTESVQTAVTSGKFTTGAVKVGAISSTYVGSGITQRDSTDLTASGATVTAPAGYYAEAASKSVASGSAGTPTATKGTVSNHSISVTPSVTNTTGYITGGTKNGTAVIVSASELVGGTKSITENGAGIDVTNYAAVDVAVSGGGLEYEEGTFVPTEDVAKPIISFANTHNEPPMFAMMIDASTTPTMETYTQYSFIYADWYRFSGTGFPYRNTSDLRYGFYRDDCRTSSTTSTTNSSSLFEYNSDQIGGNNDSTYPNYYVTNTEFKPSPSASTNRYWRAGRTYKWIAVWPPTT